MFRIAPGTNHRVYIYYPALIHKQALSFVYFQHNSIHVPDASGSSGNCFSRTFWCIPMRCPIAGLKIPYPSYPLIKLILPIQCLRVSLYHQQTFLHTGRMGRNTPHKVVWKNVLWYVLKKIVSLFRDSVVFHSAANI